MDAHRTGVSTGLVANNSIKIRASRGKLAALINIKMTRIKKAHVKTREPLIYMLPPITVFNYEEQLKCDNPPTSQNSDGFNL